MTEKDANDVLEMISEHWHMFMGGATRAMWVAYLVDQEAEAATKAVAYLARKQQEQPHISDLDEVMGMFQDKSRRELPRGVCQTCNGDRMVLVGTRLAKQSLWMKERGITPPEGAAMEEFAPCPDCNASANTSFRNYEGKDVQDLDPARTRERMMR